MSVDGLITIESALSARDTADRLAAIAEAKSLTIFARIDHAANAREIGMELRPTELLIFGNPNGGTPLMQDKQTAGIDLPLRVLVWQDSDSRVWLSYDDVRWIAKRHALEVQSETSVKAIETALAAITRAAANPSLLP